MNKKAVMLKRMKEMEYVAYLFTPDEMIELLLLPSVGPKTKKYDRLSEEYSQAIDDTWMIYHFLHCRDEPNFLDNENAQRGHEVYLKNCKDRGLDPNIPFSPAEMDEIMRNRIRLNAMLGYRLDDLYT
ncbi:MAG: hypothetical protein MJ250_02530 [Alphaproteobacteria bacterium]|nr:hypothetical protein [Alphaproteobacteria bacterium]